MQDKKGYIEGRLVGLHKSCKRNCVTIRYKLVIIFKRTEEASWRQFLHIIKAVIASTGSEFMSQGWWQDRLHLNVRVWDQYPEELWGQDLGGTVLPQLRIVPCWGLRKRITRYAMAYRAEDVIVPYHACWLEKRDLHCGGLGVVYGTKRSYC